MILFDVLYYALLVFFLLLIFRLVMEYVFMFARSYRPAGAVAALLEVCYTVTDPPLSALRRVIPPLRVGGISLDLGFLVLVILVQVLMSQVVGPLRT
jgi:YggT family protein